MLEKTKNKRLAELLDQTNEYLKNIGALVARHQEEEAEEEKRWRLEAEEKEKGKEKQGDGEDAKGMYCLLLLDNLFKDEHQLTFGTGEGEDGEAGQGKKVETYYTMAHSVEEEITKQPDLLTGGQLKHYQVTTFIPLDPNDSRPNNIFVSLPLHR